MTPSRTDRVTTVEPTRTREAVRADLLAVFRIEKASFAQPWPYRAFERFLGIPGFLVVDVDDGGETGAIAGYVVADSERQRGRPVGHLKDIAVDPSYRGRGIGATLLERALDAMYRQQVGRVKLEVRESNEPALALYRQYGFVHRSTATGYYADGEDALVLVREFD
ncbi:ribosomal protein S18-alanine N-acetyltransferase [Halococcus qingdaonensis]|uniref:ribosomal protein S18-alanine N-acetyltransferase n=1 Tax=Halococcus qingdaonensis TaxID=224402 RepID=UPI00211694D6|nr:ribosomal protein S18-alanine N-acetyltransferase [Halococcus qingdaonensis]